MSHAAARVALVSLSPWRLGKQHVSFSLAARRLQASLLSDPRLRDTEVRLFEAGSQPLSVWLDDLAEFDPDVLAASAYVWSLPTFSLLAQQIKRRRPQCITVFGGPSARPAMLSLPPFREAARDIDVLVMGEGEQVLTDIVANYGHGVSSYAALPGVALHSPLGWRATPRPQSPLSIDSLPSPYVMGLAPRNATAYMETFRGCPMSCAFCQWGNLDPSAGVLSVDALVREFEAMREAEPLGIAMVDAGLNLNARAFRNLAEAEARTGFLRGRYFDTEMYPHLMRPEHLEFLANSRSNVGLGLQSANPEVLKNVDRPFKRAHFAKVVEQLSEVSKVTVEIIMGLPGDSPEGFRETLAFLTDLPCNVRAYYCLVLPDALMTRFSGAEGLRFHPITLELQSAPGWTESALRDTREWLNERAATSGTNLQDPVVGRGDRLEDYVEALVDPPWWAFGQSSGNSPSRPIHHAHQSKAAHLPQGEAILDALHTQLSASVARATRGLCSLADVRRSDSELTLQVQLEARTIDLIARPVTAKSPSFREVSGCSFVYRSEGDHHLGRRDSALLNATIDAIANEVAPLVRETAARGAER